MSLKNRNIISIVVIAALSVGAFLFVWKVMLFGPSGPYEVKALFRDSGGITINSDVKIGGVPGGTVEEIDLGPNDLAVVTMKLDDGAFPIGTGARANSRPVNLLGEKYIELLPGDRDKPQPSGTTIPVSNTSRPVEIDDLLNVLQPDVRARMKIIFNEAGIGLAGRGADFNKVLDELPPALDETQEFVGDFSRDNAALERAIVQSDRVVTAFNRESGDLQRLVDSAATTLDITSDKRVQIGATLREAPGALRQLTGTLAELGGTATRLEPMSRELRRAAPQLTGVLQDLPPFQQDARPALRQASASAPELTRLGRDAKGPVDRLRPVTRKLATFSDRLQPVLDIADRDRGLVGLINVMNNWENVILREDGLGTTFGTFVSVDENSVEHLVDTYLNATQKKGRKRGGDAPAQRGPEQPAPLPESVTDPKKLPPLPKIKLPRLPDLPKLPELLEKVPVPQQLEETARNLGTTVDDLLAILKGQSGRGDGKGDRPTSKLLDYLLGP